MQQEDHELFEQIDRQNDQRDHRGTFQEGLRFHLWDQQSQRHGFEVGQERHSRDGNHGVDKNIAVHLHDGFLCAGDVYRAQHAEPADAEGSRHILQIAVHLQQGVVGQQIGGREEVHNVDDHQDDNGGVKRHAFEGEYIRKAKHNAGDRQGDHRQQMQQLIGQRLAGA